MKAKPANHTALPGMEQALCACGCNQYFMRVSRGRKQLYLNASHKKRVARRRAQQRQTETRVMLTPKGIATAEILANTKYERIWEMLSLEEQWVHELSTHHPAGVAGFWKAIAMLQRRAELGQFASFAEIVAVYENGG